MKTNLPIDVSLQFSTQTKDQHGLICCFIYCRAYKTKRRKRRTDTNHSDSENISSFIPRHFYIFQYNQFVNFLIEGVRK